MEPIQEPLEKSRHELLFRELSREQLFVSSDKTPYITLNDGGVYKTFHILSPEMKHWLDSRAFRSNDYQLSSKLSNEIMDTLASLARTSGVTIPVHKRVALVDGRYYLDLCDNAWNVVECIGDGWTVANHHHHNIKFRRSSSNLPIPIPTHGGNGMNLLRSVINIASEDDFRLLWGCLVSYLTPGPNPILFIVSQKDSGKSTTTNYLRSISDPSIATITGTPADEKSALIAASNSHIMALDNVSSIPPWLSDTLCRISTGCGYRAKKMYSDVEEVVLWCRCAIIVNSIHDSLITSTDLGDRAITIELPPVNESTRLSTSQLDKLFHMNHPEILGTLLDHLCWYLGSRGAFDPPDTVFRMVDFYRIMHVLESYLQWPPMSFASAYRANRQSTMDAIIDKIVVSRHIVTFMNRTPNWEGTAQSLLTELNRFAPETEKKSKDWPKTSQAMACALRVVSSNLEEYGIYARFWKQAGGARVRMIALERREN